MSGLRRLVPDRETLAFDRATVRRRDEDGRLYVEESPISKANVCPYRGREIPNWEGLGLDADRVYRLYRDPAELKRAAPTFNHLPLLREHVRVTATSHRPDLVVGSTGTGAAFDEATGHLKNSLVVWDGAAIELIDKEIQKELSSGYYYDADMTAGRTPDGAAYDGVMRNIRGNHVAVVRKGRAGSDVVVGDAALARPRFYGVSAVKFKENHMATKTPAKPKARPAFPLMAEMLLRGYLAPKLASDATIDLKPVVAALGTPKRDAKGKVGGFTFDKFKIALDAALKPKGKPVLLAQDADVADVQEVLSQLEDMAPQIADLVVGGGDTPPNDPSLDPNASADPGLPPGEPDAGLSPDGPGPSDAPPGDPAVEGENNLADDPDPIAKIMTFLQDKLSPEDLAALQTIVEGQKVATDKAVIPKAAMDAAITAAVKGVRESFKQIRAAEQDVLPYVGRLTVAMDSADEVYKFALGKLGVKVEGIHPSAFPAVLKAQPLPGNRPRAAEPKVAKDSADGLATRFGDIVGRLKTVA